MSGTIPHIIELDGTLHRLQGDRIGVIHDVREVQGARCHISDLDSAVSRVMTVESDARYAAVMVNKKLQEMGEFDESLTVISHWRRERGKNSTEIFFTALPSRRYHQYREAMQDEAGHYLVFPLYAVLYLQLKRIGTAKPVALVFQHGRFADILVGTARRIYYANRLVAFDTSAEQIESLWSTLRRDIESVAEEHRIDLERIHMLTWMDTVLPSVWPEDSHLKIEHLKGRNVLAVDENRELSFPEAVKHLPAAASIAPNAERLAFRAHRAAPYGNAAMALMVLALLGAMLGFRHLGRGMEARAEALAREVSRIEIVQPDIYSPERLAEALSFAQALDDYRNASSYRKILDDFSSGRSMDMILQRIKVTHDQGNMQVEAFGQILDPFDEAHRGYQSLLAVLKSKGYRIESERFDTRIHESSFLLKLSKGRS